jgi:outer membrane protein assembly complex protein YaeT
MRKIFYAFIYIITFATLCFAEPGESIKVIGNTFCSKESIIKNCDLPKNAHYTKDTLLSIKNNILNSAIGKFISDVELFLDKGKLTVLVKEKYLVNEVIFDGLPHGKHMILKTNKFLKSRARALVSESEIKEDLFQLKHFLLTTRGAATIFVDATYRIEAVQDNKVNVIFSVNVGPRIGIKRVQFIGNDAFSEDTLSELLITQATKKSFMAIYAPVIFSYDDACIAQDQARLEKFYQQRGFLDVKVSPAFVNLSDDLKSFEVIFSIIEGNRYSIGKTQVVNEVTSLPEKDLNKIVKKTVVIKDINRFDHLEIIKNKLIYKLCLKGYKDIEVKFEFSDVVGYVKDVNFTIANSKNYLIRKINVIGNIKTKEELIRGCLKVKEGNSYTKYDKNASVAFLMKTGLFEDVSIVKNVDKDSNYIDLDVEVVEKKTLNFNPITLHWGSEGFGFESSVRDDNFLGKGMRVKTSFSLPTGMGAMNIKNDLYQVGNKDRAFSLYLEHPYLFNYDAYFSPNIHFKWRRFYKRIPKEDLKKSLELLSKKPAFKDKISITDDDKKIKNLEKNLFFNTFRLNVGGKLNLTDNIFLKGGFGAKVNQLTISSKFTDLPRQDVKSAIKSNSKDIGEGFNNILPKVWLSCNYNSLNSDFDPKNGLNLSAKITYKELFSNFAKYKLFTDLRFYNSFFNNFFTFASQLQAGYIEKFGSSYELSARHKFHAAIPGFDIYGMEPFQSKGKEEKRVSREGTGGKFFWKLQNELRVPLGPQRMNLSGFVFCALGDVFDKFATDAEKTNAEQKLQSVKSSKKDSVHINFQRKVRGSLGIGLRFPFPLLGTTLRLEIALLTFSKDKHDLLESFKISAENDF